MSKTEAVKEVENNILQRERVDNILSPRKEQGMANTVLVYTHSFYLSANSIRCLLDMDWVLGLYLIPIFSI